MHVQKVEIDSIEHFSIGFELDIWWFQERAAEALSGFAGLLFDPTEEQREAQLREALERQEKEFHDAVRQHIICLLLFISIYLLSYWIISKFKAKPDSDSLYAGDEDYFVYRISVWMCSASLAISIGSIALLPFSVFGFELLQRFPDSYYLQWLSLSLIKSLWNYIFFLSNLSLFVVLPFCYFFIESQGFTRTRNGLMQRVYESLAVCAIFIFIILCLVDVVLAMMSSSVSLFSIRSINLPLIYSCISFGGSLLLLVSTPIGFGKMFSFIGEMSTTPPLPIEEIELAKLTADYEKRKAERMQRREKNWEDTNKSGHANGNGHYANGHNVYRRRLENSPSYAEREPLASKSVLQPATSGHIKRLKERLLRWYTQVVLLIKVPITFTLLFAFTAVSLLMVIVNTTKLLFGYRSLPVYAQYMEVKNRHALGMFGIVVETLVIIYIMTTSVVGLYSIPPFRAIRPKKNSTSLTAIIINCSMILMLSSALPVLANTLGITTFDLLGAYSSIEWLSSFRLVLSYNLLFAASSTLCLVWLVTGPIFQQLLDKLRRLHALIKERYMKPKEKGQQQKNPEAGDDGSAEDDNEPDDYNEPRGDKGDDRNASTFLLSSLYGIGDETLEFLPRNESLENLDQSQSSKLSHSLAESIFFMPDIEQVS
ncbi:hypothetical protein WR25_10802 [Diploscapter pachys]|uniref:Uncharacterized protein n=1 Tax=Diploscapter pachys TaxID=2018661 RepID=A0A2A2JBW0_9BILA|nr:hypothetical protein WR25_10802 [Diploscapter pachys]